MILTFKKMLGGTAAIALAVACTTLAAETRISSRLAAIEFNDVASQYMERPTFVLVSSFSDSNTALKVRMDEYGTGYDPLLKVPTEHATYLDRRYVPDYLPLLAISISNGKPWR